MIWHFSYHMPYQPSTHGRLGLIWHVISKMPNNLEISSSYLHSKMAATVELSLTLEK